MENERNAAATDKQDRIAALQELIIRLKQESRDVEFSAYLDKMWNDVKIAENSVSQLERLLEQNYQLYQRRMAARQMQPQGYPQGYVQPAPQGAPQGSVQTAPQGAPQGYVQPAPQGTPQGYVQSAPQSVQQSYPQPAPQSAQPQQSVEFKIGTMIFSVLGIVFLLVAFVTFGLNYLNNVLQGVFLYGIAIAVLAFSELFLAKRLEKFSYCITGLGISSIYITTILNDRYLKAFPGWAALLITMAVTAFLFYLSRKKDSGMIRIICLIGCFVSLAPVHDMGGVIGFLLPAVFIFLVNLAGVYYPVKKSCIAADVVQYVCSTVLVFYLTVWQAEADLAMWMPFILICSQILTLHLLYYRSREEMEYCVLYFVIHSISLICLLCAGGGEKWLHFSVIGVIAFYAALTALFWKKKLRFAPYLYAALYCILVYLFSGEAFWATLFCLVVFAVNKGCSRFYKEFPVPDAVYTMLAAIGVCCFARDGEVQFLGYIFAVTILLSCIFVNRYKKYHIFTSLTFGWLFLLTEGFQPFLCSILICVLAAVAIGVGFYGKDKSIRIYGLSLMVFVALKMVIYDFYESSAFMRIMVFFVVGLVILGVPLLYIFLEKKLKEQKQADLQGTVGKSAGTELNL